MSEQSWVLKGVEPETREQAVEEAARRGMSLGDYLTDVVLHTALVEQVATLAGASEDVSASETPVPEAFALRHRLKSLERRLGSAVGSLDGTLQALDSTLFDITARVGEVEALAGDTAHALSANLAGVRLHISDVEENSIARDEAAEGAHLALRDVCTGINQRIDDVEAVAHHARASAAALTDAYETLKYAVADDFSTFAREAAGRLSAGLEEVREAADSAAEQADAAVAHLVNELRTVREAIEQRVADNAAEARGRMHVAFADAAERVSALAERVTENERFSARVSDQIRAQITDVEDGLQTALEETAEGLRQADAVLANDMARAQREALAAVASVHAELADEIAEVREDHLTAATRIKLLDVAIGTTTGEITTLRETFSRQIAQIALDGAAHRESLERQITQGELSAGAARETLDRQLGQFAAETRQSLALAQTDWDQRFDAIVARLAAGERDSGEVRHALEAETQRVEACTFAALEKLARDIAAGDAAIEASLSEVVAAALQARRHADASITDVRDQQLAAVSRLQRLETGLAALEAHAAPVGDRFSKLEGVAHALDTEFAARIARLERAAENGAGSHQLAALQQQIEALAASRAGAKTDSDTLQLIEDLRARIGGAEAQSGEIADRLHGVAKVVSRFTTQQAETSAQGEERLHKLELAIADFRLTQFSPSDTSAQAETITAIAERLDQMEQRQTEALHALQTDILRFVADNDQRLAALEQGEAPPSGLEQQFVDLRQRIEERILGVEQRGVRTLEHVADTIALLEKRFLDNDQARESA